MVTEEQLVEIERAADDGFKRCACEVCATTSCLCPADVSSAALDTKALVAEVRRLREALRSAGAELAVPWATCHCSGGAGGFRCTRCKTRDEIRAALGEEGARLADIEHQRNDHVRELQRAQAIIDDAKVRIAELEQRVTEVERERDRNATHAARAEKVAEERKVDRDALKLAAEALQAELDKRGREANELEAQVERMRSVIRAAVDYRQATTIRGIESALSLLIGAVDAYRAQGGL